MQQTKWRDVPKQNGDADGEEEASNAKSAEENEKKTQKRKEAESEKKMAARWLTAVGQGWPVEMHAKRRAREEEEKKQKTSETTRTDVAIRKKIAANRSNTWEGKVSFLRCYF